MDEMREKFSEHCQLWRYSEEVDENDFFVNATTQRAWDVWGTAWQASRQALVVKFTTETYFSPCKTDLELASDKGFNSAMDSVKSALDAAGVRYE